MKRTVELSAWLLFLVFFGSLCGIASFHRYLRTIRKPLDIDAPRSHTVEDSGAIVSRDDEKIPLRILPLGASIVFGWGSSDGNGFRKPLRDALRDHDWEVDMVGSKHGGDMKDWESEAVPGAIVNEIRGYLQGSLPFKPNVVVINGGTNDCIRDIDISGIGVRMEHILNDIWSSDKMSDTCIMLSTLIPNAKTTARKNLPSANKQYRDLVSKYAGKGKCIFLADMNPPSPDPANNWIALDRDITADGTHPNDQGHRKMASIFYNAINEAYKAGKIKKAADFQNSPTYGCDKVYGSGIYAGGLTQTGSGLDDGIYYHASEYQGVVFNLTSEWDRDQWRFARLFSIDRDDIVGWYQQSETEHAFGVWRNNGNGEFARISDMFPHFYCIPRGLHFIDMTADGLDDIVCIYPDGSLHLAVNNGDGTDKKPPSFKSIGKIKNPEATQEHVRLGDVDGDGRGDYCIVADNGDITCWRNGWVDPMPKYWQPLGKRFSGKEMGDIRGVRFEDLNGDGRDDWLWLSDVGETYTYTNARSCQKGKNGVRGLNVAWRQGFAKGKHTGPTHNGMAGIGHKDHHLRSRIHFARVYGSPQNFGLLGRQDYVYLEHTEHDGKHLFQVHVWKNNGVGGTKLKADGDKYCNMVGNDDGRMDHVWVNSHGPMTLFPNAGHTQLKKGQSFWGPKTEVIWEPRKYIGKDTDRRDLHLTDWDGDGTCDIVWTDPDNNNAVQVWINKYPETKSWDNWDFIGNAAPQLKCNQKRGLGIDDLAVRFADISGSGRGDYLCLEKDGRVTAFLHTVDDTWLDVGQVKYAEGRDRANLRWADVNGDGRDDLLWIDKFNGDGYVSYNRGQASRDDHGGSLYYWQKIDDPVYEGNHAGTCMFYPDLDGNGRADMHSLTGTFTNHAETWFNPSCGLQDRTGDDPVSSPGLPQQPGSPGTGSGGGPDGQPPYKPNPGDDNPYPICQNTYDSLDDLINDVESIPFWCGPQYVLTVLLQMLHDAVDHYNDIIDDGYDSYFDVYADYIVSESSESLIKYMRDRGNDYFDCQVTEERACCKSCDFEHVSCDYCKEECVPSSPYDDGHSYINISEPCPPDMSKRGLEGDGQQSIWWSLRDDKADEFWTNVTGEIGAPEDKLPMTYIQDPWDSAFVPSADCKQHLSDGNMPPECFWKGWWFNAPKVNNFTTSDVVNPKDLVKESLDKSSSLIPNIAIVSFQVRSGMYVSESPEDLVDALAFVVLMIQQSVDLMDEVVEMAKKIEDANKLSLITTFLSAILFVVPVLGESLASLGLVTLGRILTYLGETGNIGLGIYGAATTPESLPLSIFGFVLSGRSILNANAVGRAAAARRSMSRRDLAGISKTVADRLNAISRVSNQEKRPTVCRAVYA